MAVLRGIFISVMLHFKSAAVWTYIQFFHFVSVWYALIKVNVCSPDPDFQH